MTELFVCYAHDSYLSELRKKRFNSFYMYSCIFAAGTMTDIYGELKHRKSITLQVLTEIGVSLFVFLRLGRQIEKNQYPHNPIFTKTVHFKTLDKRFGEVHLKNICTKKL